MELCLTREGSVHYKYLLEGVISSPNIRMYATRFALCSKIDQIYVDSVVEYARSVEWHNTSIPLNFVIDCSIDSMSDCAQCAVESPLKICLASGLHQCLISIS